MWVQAGFAPDDFWHQTPLHFQIAMRGVRKRLENEADIRIAQSWTAAAFNGAAQNGKLKPLKHYLCKKAVVQSPNEMLAALLAHQSSGAKMTIREIKIGE